MMDEITLSYQLLVYRTIFQVQHTSILSDYEEYILGLSHFFLLPAASRSP